MLRSCGGHRLSASHGGEHLTGEVCKRVGRCKMSRSRARDCCWNSCGGGIWGDYAGIPHITIVLATICSGILLMVVKFRIVTTIVYHVIACGIVAAIPPTIVGMCPHPVVGVSPPPIIGVIPHIVMTVIPYVSAPIPPCIVVIATLNDE